MGRRGNCPQISSLGVYGVGFDSLTALFYFVIKRATALAWRRRRVDKLL